MSSDPDTLAGWVILELLGHRRLAGYLTEQPVAGITMLRLDIPTDPPVTQIYGSGAVYCITPTTEEIARAVARRNQPQPVQRWELEPAKPYEDGDGEDPYEREDPF